MENCHVYYILLVDVKLMKLFGQATWQCISKLTEFFSDNLGIL
jgi:hypothetical protein